MSKIKFFTLLGLLCVGFIKSLFIAPAFPDVAILAVVGFIFAYTEYHNKDKKLDELVSVIKTHGSDLEDLKNKMSSIKLVQQMKPGSLNFK